MWGLLKGELLTQSPQRSEKGRLGIKGLRGISKFEIRNAELEIGEGDRGTLLRSVSVNLAELRRAPSEGGLWENVDQ